MKKLEETLPGNVTPVGAAYDPADVSAVEPI